MLDPGWVGGTGTDDQHFTYFTVRPTMVYLLDVWNRVEVEQVPVFHVSGKEAQSTSAPASQTVLTDSKSSASIYPSERS